MRIDSLLLVAALTKKSDTELELLVDSFTGKSIEERDNLKFASLLEDYRKYKSEYVKQLNFDPKEKNLSMIHHEII